MALYCRLGFAKKKNIELDNDTVHPSWYDHIDNRSSSVRSGSVELNYDSDDDSLLTELNKALESDVEDAMPEDGVDGTAGPLCGKYFATCYRMNSSNYRL